MDVEHNIDSLIEFNTGLPDSLSRTGATVMAESCAIFSAVITCRLSVIDGRPAILVGLVLPLTQCVARSPVHLKDSLDGLISSFLLVGLCILLLQLLILFVCCR